MRHINPKYRNFVVVILCIIILSGITACASRDRSRSEDESTLSLDMTEGYHLCEIFNKEDYIKAVEILDNADNVRIIDISIMTNQIYKYFITYEVMP